MIVPAGPLRRALAVVVDFVVLYAFWIGVGFLGPYSGVVGFAAFFLFDVVLTAFLGLSIGRLVTGIRVIRLSNGLHPGLARAALRTTIVFATGVFGVIIFLAYMRGDPQDQPARLWWDQAAGTMLVHHSRAPVVAGAQPAGPTSELAHLRGLPRYTLRQFALTFLGLGTTAAATLLGTYLVSRL